MTETDGFPEHHKKHHFLHKVSTAHPQMTVPEDSSSTVTQTAAHYWPTIEYYGPDIIMGTGASLLGIMTLISIRRFVRKVRDRLGSRSKMRVKAPVHMKENNSQLLVRSTYPEQVKPAFGIKIKPTRKQIQDTPAGQREYENIKNVLRHTRKNTCQCCGLIFPNCEFHHLNDNHRDHRAENLAMLCRYCHLQYHYDVSLREGSLAAFCPDISVAELSHVHQYVDYVKYETSHGKRQMTASETAELENIKSGLKKRTDLAMSLIKSKSIKRLCEYDQRIAAGEKLKLSNTDIQAIKRFRSVRHGLRVVFPYDSVINTGYQKRALYSDTAYGFINASRMSFPKGGLEGIIKRLLTDVKP